MLESMLEATLTLLFFILIVNLIFGKFRIFFDYFQIVGGQLDF